MKSLFPLFLSLFFISSCKNETKKEISFSDIQSVVGEKIAIHERIYPDFFHIKSDYLIVSSSKTDTMLYVYSLPQLEFISSAGRKGRGPNEIPLFPMFCNSESETSLYIWGYTPSSLKKISFDEAGKFIYESDIRLNFYDAFNNMYLEDDLSLIYYSPTELVIKKYSVKDRKITDEIIFKSDKTLGSYNPEIGVADIGPSHIVYAFGFKKQINIYDKRNFELLTVLTDNESYDPPAPSEPQGIVRQYYNIIAGDKRFYALSPSKRKDEDSEGKTLMEVFDYKGNPVGKYEFDTFLNPCIIDEKRGYVYGYSSVYPDSFLKYKLGFAKVS